MHFSKPHTYLSYLLTSFLRSGVLSPFHTVQNPSLYFPPSEQMKLPSISQRSLKPYTVNSQPPSLLTQGLFLSSPIFCSFLFLVSESDCLEKSGPSIHLLDFMHYRLSGGEQGSFCHLPPPTFISLISPPPLALSCQVKIRLKCSFPKNTFPWPSFSFLRLPYLSLFP